MKLYFNNLIIIITSSFLMISCSSLSDLDISSIIDKTENWLFYEEDQSDIEVSTNNKENILEENLDVEEVFPDINDIPQVKPEFEQIDEEFFDSEENKEEDIETNTNTSVSKISKKK